MAYLGDPTAPDHPHYLEAWAKYLRGLDPVHRPLITKELVDYWCLYGTPEQLQEKTQLMTRRRGRHGQRLPVQPLHRRSATSPTSAPRSSPTPDLAPARPIPKDGHDHLDPTRTALIAVHLQNDIVGADGAFAPLLPRPDRPRRHARHRRPAARRRPRRRRPRSSTPASPGNPATPTCTPTPPCSTSSSSRTAWSTAPTGAAIIDELTPQDTDLVVTHQRVGGFHDSELDDVLRSRGSRHRRSSSASPPTPPSKAPPAPPPTWATASSSSATPAAPPRPPAHAASLESLGLLAEITTTDELIAAFAPQPADATT